MTDLSEKQRYAKHILETKNDNEEKIEKYEPAFDYKCWYDLVESRFAKKGDKDLSLSELLVGSINEIASTLDFHTNSYASYVNGLQRLGILKRTHPVADVIRISQIIEDQDCLKFDAYKAPQPGKKELPSKEVQDQLLAIEKPVLFAITNYHIAVRNFLFDIELKSRTSLMHSISIGEQPQMSDAEISSLFLKGDKCLAVFSNRVKYWEMLAKLIN